MLAKQLLGILYTVFGNHRSEAFAGHAVQQDAYISLVGGKFRSDVIDSKILLAEQLLLFDEGRHLLHEVTGKPCLVHISRGLAGLASATDKHCSKHEADCGEGSSQQAQKVHNLILDRSGVEYERRRICLEVIDLDRYLAFFPCYSAGKDHPFARQKLCRSARHVAGVVGIEECRCCLAAVEGSVVLDTGEADAALFRFEALQPDEPGRPVDLEVTPFYGFAVRVLHGKRLFHFQEGEFPGGHLDYCSLIAGSAYCRDDIGIVCNLQIFREEVIVVGNSPVLQQRNIIFNHTYMLHNSGHIVSMRIVGSEYYDVVLGGGKDVRAGPSGLERAPVREPPVRGPAFPAVVSHPVAGYYDAAVGKS